MTILYFILLLALDQGTKYWTRVYLRPRGSISLIGDFFHLTYVENRGAAFGILQGQAILFVIITIVAILLLYYYYIRQQNKNGKYLKFLSFILLMIAAGACGNLIDRVFLGFVTDMIDVRGIWTFVFNVADIYVVCGTILLCFYILKFDAENDR
ncbi:MAG: signal peptidase II [Peptostreptococcaceae bacterium]|nr:signal peptidase II [Peptostreptococcaceae bacterium]